MAVNKNFVIKNGLEVSEDLIIADPIESRVGVGTTVPEYTLHVNGGIGATNLYVTGVSTFVGFSTFNDNVNIQGDLDVTGGITFTGVTTAFDDVVIQGNLAVAGITTLASTGGITTTGGDLYVNTDFIVGAGATVGGALTVAGNVDLNSDLDVDGRTELDITNISETLNVSGISTFGDTVEISSLTENRIPIVGAGSSIEDDANLTFDGSQLVVAVGATVGGALTVAGNVDLNADLDVDGRTELDITNISETLNVTGISTFENNVNVNQDLTVSGNLDVSGISTFNDTVTFNSDGVLVGTISSTAQKFGGIETWPELESANVNADLSDPLNLVKVTSSGSGWVNATSTLTTKTSGKYYAEVTVNNFNAQDTIAFGVRNNLSSGNLDNGNDDVYIGRYENEYGLRLSSVTNNNSALGTSGLASFVPGQKIGILLNLDDNQITFSQNGSLGNTYTIASGLNYEFAISVFYEGIDSLTINFGETAFSYLPAGYQALNQISPYVEVDNSGLDFVGVSTFADDVTISGDLNVTGDLDLSGNLNVTGLSTFRDSVNIDGGDLNVSGVVTATSFDGAGQIGISSGGTLIGAAATIVDFTSTNAVVTVTETSAGIATVDISPTVSLGLVLALGG